MPACKLFSPLHFCGPINITTLSEQIPIPNLECQFLFGQAITDLTSLKIVTLANIFAQYSFYSICRNTSSHETNTVYIHWNIHLLIIIYYLELPQQNKEKHDEKCHQNTAIYELSTTWN